MKRIAEKDERSRRFFFDKNKNGLDNRDFLSHFIDKMKFHLLNRKPYSVQPSYHKETSYILGIIPFHSNETKYKIFYDDTEICWVDDEQVAELLVSKMNAAYRVGVADTMVYIPEEKDNVHEQKNSGANS